MNAKVKRIRQSQLSKECWDVQIWGLDYCQKCQYKDHPECGGKSIRQTGLNEKGFPAGINILYQDKCNIVYDVDGVVIRLWAIVGGQLAIAFDDYSFIERYNQCDKFAHKWDQNDGPTVNYLKRDNKHKNYKNAIEGIEIIKDFINRNNHKRILRKKRIETLLNRYKNKIKLNKLQSRRYHDLNNKTYFRCEFNVINWYCTPVTVCGTQYSGRCDEIIDKWADQNWVALKNHINPLFDKEFKMWEELTEDEFNIIVKLLDKVAV